MDEQPRQVSAPTLGLVLFSAVVLAGGATLELLLPPGASQLLRGGLPVAVLVGLAAYVLLVFLPERRFHQECRRRLDTGGRQLAAIETALAELKRGDLVKVAREHPGMAEHLGAAVGAATRALESLIRLIQRSSIEVAEAAQAVHATAADLASGSSEQAAGVVEITATMEELARTAGQIATNAGAQAELAGKAELAGNDGAAAVQAALEAVDAARGRMNAIAERTDALGTRSREIYGILDLITEIAQETHILALNAAIEASAAGEHGTRFSVVADEVRRLAERSHESVDSVRRLLDDFSQSLREAVVATEQGSKAAAQVFEQSQAAAAAIEELRGALGETAQASREISLATQEQRTASDQVVVTLREVSDVIQRMADGLKQFTSSAENLSQLGLSIQLLTQSFRIESERSLKHVLLNWTDRLAGFTVHGEIVEGLFEEMLQKCPYLELLYVVDARGAMVAFKVNAAMVGGKDLPGDVAVGQVYADRPWFQAAIREGRAALTPVYESVLTGQGCFTVSASITDADGRQEGVLAADVNVLHWTRI